MEIIYKSTKGKSNFAYYTELFKNNKILNGFNKLGYCPISNNTIECGDIKFDKEIIGNLYLCYPLSVVIKNKIKFNSLYSIINEIRKTYREIYKDKESCIKYGVWGHDINDLIIEGIVLYKDNSVQVSIGS